MKRDQKEGEPDQREPELQSVHVRDVQDSCGHVQPPDADINTRPLLLLIPL